jgi:hypothetical protein
MAVLVAAIHFPETVLYMAEASGKWVIGTSPVMTVWKIISNQR